ncbi:MAG: galactitol-1-phosphate 5-dehydrogenase [Spirochaetaceae bacterium]|nr:MAG: galactitol-1-phosphate 5-dehydrogenase [Spirochaetaceae bacterium]
MQAIVLKSQGQLEIEQRPLPERFGPGQALVRVAAAGICGSDIPRAFDGKAYHYPLVLGHEFSAVVEDPADSGLQAGQRVVVFPLLPRLDDPFSLIGEYAVSSDYDYYGSRRDGGMQQYLWVPRANLIPVPDHVSLVAAAMTEPAAVSLHAVSKLRVASATVALVIGGGPIGVMVAQFLRIRGCTAVWVAEPDGRKRELARNLGFDVIDPTAEDTVAAIAERSNGRGADCVVEAVGLALTFEQAFRACATFGQLVLLGNPAGSLSLSAELVSTILRRELTIYGTWNSKVTPVGHSEWDEVLGRMGQTLVVEPLISHRVTIAEAPAIMEAMYSRQTWFNKVIVQMDPELR